MTGRETYKNFLELGLNGFKKLPATKQWEMFESLPTPKQLLEYIEEYCELCEVTRTEISQYSELYHRTLQYFEATPKATVLRKLAARYRDGKLTTKCNLEEIAEEFS